MRLTAVGLVLAIGACLVASWSIWRVADPTGQSRRRAPNAPTSPNQIRPAESSEQTHADAGVVVRGVVRDRDTGQPVPGARVLTNLVELAQSSPVRPILRLSDLATSGVTTDAHGRFAMRATTTSGRLVVCVLATDYEPCSRELKEDECAKPLEIRLEGDDPIRYRVQDEDGVPIAGAVALLYPQYPGLDGVPVASARSGADGTFLLRASSFDRLVVARHGYATIQRYADFGSRTIVLRRGFALRVLARDSSGKPVHGAHVRIEASDARLEARTSFSIPPEQRSRDEWLVGTTGTDGVCEFADVPFALWRVDVGGEGFATAKTTEWSGARELHVTLRRAASVSGEIVLANGDPAVGASVSGTSRPTDSRGRFRIDGCPPGRLTIDAWGAEWALGHGSATVELEAGEHREGVVVRLEPDDEPVGHAMDIRVLDWERRPVPGLAILVRPLLSRPRSAVVCSDGSVDLPPLPMIASYQPHGMFSSCELDLPVTDAAGAAVARTDLPPGAAVVVRACPVDRLRGRLTPGERLDCPPDALAAECVAVVGRAEVVEIRLPHAVPHTFVVRSPTGEELPEAWVWVTGNARRIEGGRDFVLDPSATFHLFAFYEPSMGLREDDHRLGYLAQPRWRPQAGASVTGLQLLAPDSPEDEAFAIKTLRGRVVALGEVPVGGALVTTIFETPFAEYFRPCTVTHRDGTFELRADDDVSFVRVTRQGYGARVARLAETDAIVLAPEGVLRVRLESHVAWSPDEWRVDLSVPLGHDQWHTDPKRIETLDAGRFCLEPAATGNLIELEVRREPGELREFMPGDAVGEVRGLGAGPLRVRLWSSGFEQIREVRIEPGVTTDVTFRLP